MAKNNEKNIKDKTSFFKSFKAELKKVIWPTPKQLINNTVAVLSIVVIMAVIVFILDFAFESMNKYGIDKIKDAVSKDSISENVVDVENEITENEALENIVETTDAE